MTGRPQYDEQTVRAEQANCAYARRAYGEGIYSAGFRKRLGGGWQYELVKGDRQGVTPLEIGIGLTLTAAVEDCNRQLMALIVGQRRERD